MQIRTAFITGASSGIGYALAKRLAREGVQVAIAARRTDQLEELKSAIEAAGGRAHVYQLDVRDAARVNETLRRADDELGGIDCVIANAGLANNRRAQKFRWDECQAMLEVNVIGAAATLTAILDRMITRKRGMLVGVSSIAGMRAMPGMSAYSASKTFVSRFLEGLRLDLEGTGVLVTDVLPGYVESEMTAKHKERGMPMPFKVSAEKAADIIVRGLYDERREIAFPWQMKALMGTASVLPEALASKGLRKMM